MILSSIYMKIKASCFKFSVVSSRLNVPSFIILRNSNFPDWIACFDSPSVPCYSGIWFSQRYIYAKNFSFVFKLNGSFFLIYIYSRYIILLYLQSLYAYILLMKCKIDIGFLLRLCTLVFMSNKIVAWKGYYFTYILVTFKKQWHFNYTICQICLQQFIWRVKLYGGLLNQIKSNHTYIYITDSHAEFYWG